MGNELTEEQEQEAMRERIIAEVAGVDFDNIVGDTVLTLTAAQIQLCMSKYKNDFIHRLKSDGHTFTYWGGETNWDSYDDCLDKIDDEDAVAKVTNQIFPSAYISQLIGKDVRIFSELTGKWRTKQLKITDIVIHLKYAGGDIKNDCSIIELL